MGVREEVLRTLRAAAGGTISGQALADQLGVSRHAVWKAIDKLRSEGYDIQARTNHGYQLVGAADPFSAEGVATFLAPAGVFSLEYHETIDSTNNRARALAEAEAPEWTVVLAGRQTAGRGRMGKSFYSPQAGGIYMSVVVRPQCDVLHANMLTIAAAAAVAESIEAVCGVETQIKWVNDLFVGARKVCGILTEASVGVEEQTLRYAVVGIGVNVSPPPGGFPQELSEIAASIFESPLDREVRNRLAAEILMRFRAYAEDLLARRYLASYRSHFMAFDRRVTLVRGRIREEVVVRDLTEDGALVVETDDGQMKTVASGEMSLRFETKEDVR